MLHLVHASLELHLVDDSFGKSHVTAFAGISLLQGLGVTPLAIPSTSAHVHDLGFIPIVVFEMHILVNGSPDIPLNYAAIVTFSATISL